MTTMRNSSATKPNPALLDTAADQSTVRSLASKGPAAQVTSNLQWLKATGLKDGILLLGGTSLAHFRVRVAQGHLRSDLLPSYWSLVGLLVGGDQLISVPLDSLDETSLVPLSNGVQSRPLSEFDDTTKFPNIAVLQFTNDTAPVVATVDRIKRQRSIIDLPTLIISWLSFIWVAGDKTNPLTLGMGLPSAAFTETAYGMAGVELTPGLSSSASCPEAIWQTAKWWHDFYAKPEGVENADHAGSIIPKGTYAIRQPAAAAIGPKDEKRGDMIVARDEPSGRAVAKRRNIVRTPRSKKTG